VGELRLGSGISMLKDGRRKWSGVAGFGDGAARCGGTGGEKKGLMCGAHMSVIGEEKRCLGRMRKPEGKMPFGECAKALRADWAERGGGSLRYKAGWLRRAGSAGLVPKEGFKMEIDFEFQMNLDFGKTLRDFTRRFRWNLNMRIFPKFF
jgi:hypothetical protein